MKVIKLSLKLKCLQDAVEVLGEPEFVSGETTEVIQKRNREACEGLGTLSVIIAIVMIILVDWRVLATSVATLALICVLAVGASRYSRDTKEERKKKADKEAWERRRFLPRTASVIAKFSRIDSLVLEGVGFCFDALPKTLGDVKISRLEVRLHEISKIMQ